MNGEQEQNEHPIDFGHYGAPRAPARDLWPEIESRLNVPRRRARWPYAVAASLVAGLAAALWLALPAPVPVGPVERARLPIGEDSRAIIEAHLQILQQSERQIEYAMQAGGRPKSMVRLQQANLAQQQQLQTMLGQASLQPVSTEQWL